MSKREQTLFVIFALAHGKPVWGFDRRGRGGRFRANDVKTDGWEIPVSDLVYVCIEGNRDWVRLTFEER